MDGGAEVFSIGSAAGPTAVGADENDFPQHDARQTRIYLSPKRIRDESDIHQQSVAPQAITSGDVVLLWSNRACGQCELTSRVPDLADCPLPFVVWICENTSPAPVLEAESGRAVAQLRVQRDDARLGRGEPSR